MSDLLPCPFCGGAAAFDGRTNLRIAAQCDAEDCHVRPRTNLSQSREEVATFWNRRAQLPPSPDPARDMAERIVGWLQTRAEKSRKDHPDSHDDIFLDTIAVQIRYEFLPAEKGHDNG